MTRVKLVKAQLISTSCFVCGNQNPAGLHTRFFIAENGEVIGVYRSRPEHQSYPGRQHGGVTAAILDETLGRAIIAAEPESWGVTMHLSLTYRKPVPLGCTLTATARVTRNSRRAFDAEGELRTPDGAVVATATGRYIKFKLSQIVAECAPGTDPDADVIPDPEPMPESIPLF